LKKDKADYKAPTRPRVPPLLIRGLLQAAHTTAMKYYAISMGDHASYNNERRKASRCQKRLLCEKLSHHDQRALYKQVSLDAKQSKVALEVYLRHKKAYLTASAEADNPMTSTKAKRLLTQSTKSLRAYKTFQANIKTSYAKASMYQRRFFKTSKDYQEKSVAAKAIATRARKASLASKTSSAALGGAGQRLAAAQVILKPATKDKKAADATKGKAKAKYSEANAKVKAAQAKWTALASLAEKLKAMADNAKASSKRNKLRMMEHQAQAKAKGLTIRAIGQSRGLQKLKYQAAKKTSDLYLQSYKLAQCHTAAKSKVRQAASCAGDKRVADANLEAYKSTLKEHNGAKNRLDLVTKEKAEANKGAVLANKMLAADVAKATRLLASFTAVSRLALNPC